MRATEAHKVFVWSCAAHGTTCTSMRCRANPDYYGKGNLKSRGAKAIPRWTLQELRVSELKSGMRLLKPESIPYGSHEEDPETAYVNGLYLADGWINHKYERQDGTEKVFDFAIAGKDGFPKEAQKMKVQAICADRGIPTRWDERYIAVKDSEWATRLSSFGSKAWTKAADRIDLSEASAKALLKGIMADSGQASQSSTLVYSSTSYKLALQLRLLFKMQGISTSCRYLENHGGLGTHPIWRVSPYQNNEGRYGMPIGQASPYGLHIKSIEREVEETECYDLTTDDHYVYLPDSDIVVHNCDDSVTLLCALFESINLPWRLVLSGKHVSGQKVRYIEGQAVPSQVGWSHIYCMVGTPPFNPNRWWFCETTIPGVPLGWDVIAGDHSYLPEMQKGGGASTVVELGAAPSWFRPASAPAVANRSPAFQAALGDALSSSVGTAVAEELEDTTQKGTDWGKMALAVATGVAVSVTTQIALDWIRGKELWEGRGLKAYFMDKGR